MKGALDRIIAREIAARPRGRRVPYALAAIVALSSVGLLGLSGWFLAGAALAGVAGAAVANAFNYLLPAAAIRLMAIARTGARYGERLIGHDRALTVTARIRAALYRSIAAMPPAEALVLGRGEATARLVQDVAAVEGALIRRPAPWAAGSAIAAAIAMAALGGWGAALVVALGFGGALLSARAIAARLTAPGRRVQRETGALKNLLADQLAAAPELRCFGLEASAIDAIDRHARALATARADHARGSMRLDLILPLAGMILSIAALALAAPSGSALAALAALATLAASGELAGYARALAERGAVEEAERRLDDYLSTPALPDPTLDLGAAPDVAILSQPATRHGPFILLSGASGTGKTTLAETLVGLRPPVAGMARIGGIYASLIPPATLRATFAWMPQDAQLLTGTVRDNLSLARPDGGDALFWAALEDAAIADRVRTMPDGLDSWIGENGEALSGGERRRLALARAYCADAPWLLLDEPFEGIDRDTADAMEGRLRARMERSGQRAILISHRAIGQVMATAEAADTASR